MDGQSRVKLIGERVKQLRLEKGITQLELAAKCNIEQSSIARIESGKTNPTILTLYSLCDALEIDINDLF